MKYSYLQLKDYAAQRRGAEDFDSLDTDRKNVVEIGINQMLNAVWYHKTWGFAGRELRLTTVAPFATGTAEATAGEHYVTISGTSLTVNNGKLPFRGSFFATGNKLYKITRVDTGNNRFVLENPLTESITAGSGYKVYFLEYPLRWDVGAIRNVVLNTIKPLDTRPRSMAAVDFEEGELDVMSTAGITEADYATCTGNLANGSNELLSVSGVTIDQTLIGMAIVADDALDVYYIIDIDASGTKFYLDRIFTGTSVTSQTFLINPKGLPMITFKPYPLVKDVVKIEYTFQPPMLRDDKDYTLLPNDLPMLKGIDVMTTSWETVGERGFINEVLFQDKKFVQSMKVLSYRNTPLHRRLYSLNELHNKFTLRNSNPWNRGL